MRPSIFPGLAVCTLALTLSLPAQKGGVLVFKDGRWIQAPEIHVEKDAYRLVYPHGQVKVPTKLLLKAVLLDPTAQMKGLSSADKAKMEKGLVPYKGRWVSRSRLAFILAKEKKKLRAKMEEIRRHSQWRDRYKETTRHFAFEYTIPPEIARNYINFFEAYWKVFNKRWRIRQPPRLGKLKICIYNNQKDFLRIGNGDPGTLGYFRFVEPLEINFYHDRRDVQLTLSVLWHECNHYFMYLFVQKGVNNPSWLEEGLAEYFGGSKWDPKTRKMTPGLIQEGRLVALHDAMDGNEYQKLEPLMRQGSRISSIQYAWSWSLCHMLFSKKKYAKGFNRFIVKMAKDKTLKKEPWPGNPDFRWVKPDVQIALFKKCLKIKDLAALEKEWYAYIKKMKVKGVRGYYEAALDCVRWKRPIRAGLYFKKAMEIDPNYISTYEAYSRLLYRQDKYKEAREIAQKGIERDPINPTFYLVLARIEWEKGSKQKAERLCNLAMDLAPDDVDVRWQAQLILEK